MLSKNKLNLFKLIFKIKLLKSDKTCVNVNNKLKNKILTFFKTTYF